MLHYIVLYHALYYVTMLYIQNNNINKFDFI